MSEPNEIERRAVEKRLKESGISPDTVDISEHWDNTLKYAENVRNVEQYALEGKTIETEKQRENTMEAEVEANEDRSQKRYGEMSGMSGEEAAYWREKNRQETEAKKTAQEREEKYKGEGDILGRYFEHKPEKKKEYPPGNPAEGNLEKHFTVQKKPSAIAGLVSAVGSAAERARSFAEERIPLTPISGESHISKRERYLKRTEPVYKKEAEVSKHKHEIESRKLLEKKKKIELQQAQKSLEKPYYKPSANGQVPARVNRMQPSNLPFLGDVAVIKRSPITNITPNTGLLQRREGTGMGGLLSSQRGSSTIGPGWKGPDWRKKK